MAAPHVAAAAALVIASGVLGRHPTPGQILARLEQTAQSARRLQAPNADLRLRPGRRGGGHAPGVVRHRAPGPTRRAPPPDQVVRTISTEHGAWWETLFGTEPSRKRLAPVMPLLPTTIRSAPLLLGHVEDRVGGIPLAGESLHLSDAGCAAVRRCLLEQSSTSLARIDRPLHVLRDLDAARSRSRWSATGS